MKANSFKRVLIIAPNLEPQKCGVSDYTSILKNFFLNEHAIVYQFAISDNYINQVEQGDFFFRVPIKTTTQIRNAYLKKIIEDFVPDLIIFNYVSYALHKKGIPVWLNKTAALFASTNTTRLLIFHELWIGNFKEERAYHKFLGFFQKAVIRGFIKHFNANQIFVTTAIAKFVLAKKSIKSHLLNVFSNITIYQEKLLSNELIGKFDKWNFKDVDTIFMSFFGGIFDYMKVELFLKFLQQQSILSNKKIIVFLAGNIRNDYIWNYLQNNPINNIQFIKLGIMKDEDVSLLFQYVDYGLSSYPESFWSKSGAIAAMLSHGLQVIAIGPESDLDGLKKDILIHPNIINMHQLPINFNLVKRDCLNLQRDYNKNIFRQMIENIK